MTKLYLQIIIHPDYYSASHINDLAILTWDEPLDMDNANIGVICLPDKDDIFDNQDCVATGWGKSIACELQTTKKKQKTTNNKISFKSYYRTLRRHNETN